MNDTTDFDDNESRRAFILTYLLTCKSFAECVLTALHEGMQKQ